MKKNLIFVISLLISVNSYCANLMDVFQHALTNDNLYQQATFKTLSSQEDIAINRSYLLPNARLNLQPLILKQGSYGAIVPLIAPPNNTLRNYDMRLSLSQPIFNLAIVHRYQTSKISARASQARLNADLQNLMIRVADAYFEVLRAHKKVSYLHKHKNALAKQLYNVQQKFKVGKTTKTYVFLAQSYYSKAESELISAETQLISSQEYLSQLTATEYPFLADLDKKIPLVSPHPSNIDKWVKKGLLGNWLIKANQLKVEAAREKIKQLYADHYPTLDANLSYDDDSFHNSQGSNLIAQGSSRVRVATALLNFKVPLYSGGLVGASTRKATYKFRIAQNELDYSIRKVTYHIRDSYRNILSSIKKIKYTQDTIQSAQSSLIGLTERYIAGGGNLSDVLDQQAQLTQAQTQYESARYDYIMNLLRLKKEAGVLSVNDLQIVNHWLHETD